MLRLRGARIKGPTRITNRSESIESDPINLLNRSESIESDPIDHQILVVGEGKGFALLGNIDPYDVDVFSSKQMPALIGDLKKVRTSIVRSDLKAHIDRIIELAALCEKLPGATLTISPYAAPSSQSVISRPH